VCISQPAVQGSGAQTAATAIFLLVKEMKLRLLGQETQIVGLGLANRVLQKRQLHENSIQKNVSLGP